MKRYAKEAMREAQRLGFTHEGTNSKGFRVYVGGVNSVRVLIDPSSDEVGARAVIAQLHSIVGTRPDTSRKRNPQQVRQRQARERARLAEQIGQHERLLATLRQHKEAALAESVAAADVLDIERQIETAERELAQYRNLMTEIPASREHRGRGAAKHRAGAA